jgi:hypothetical protein
VSAYSPPCCQHLAQSLNLGDFQAVSVGEPLRHTFNVAWLWAGRCLVSWIEFSLPACFCLVLLDQLSSLFGWWVPLCSSKQLKSVKTHVRGSHQVSLKKICWNFLPLTSLLSGLIYTAQGLEHKGFNQVSSFLERVKLRLPYRVSCVMLSLPVLGRTSLFHLMTSICSGFYFLTDFHSSRQQPQGGDWQLSCLQIQWMAEMERDRNHS